MQNSIVKKLFPLLIPSLLAMLSACNDLIVKGDGDLITEQRDAKNFTALQINVPGKIEVRRGDFAVEITVEESLLPYLETEVRNGRLDIYFSKAVRDVDDLVVKITAPALDDFELNGSAELVVLDSLAGQKLRVDISGSGELETKHIDFQQIDVEINGSGEIRLAGTADDLLIEISGSGAARLLDCPVRMADVEISGSGELRCAVSDLLKAEISGSGDVFYLGDPAVEADISGSGKVKKL